MWGPSTKREALFPTLAVSRRASVVRGEEAGQFREVAGVSIVVAGCLRSAVVSSNIDTRVTSSFNIKLNMKGPGCQHPEPPWFLRHWFMSVPQYSL